MQEEVWLRATGDGSRCRGLRHGSSGGAGGRGRYEEWHPVGSIDDLGDHTRSRNSREVGSRSSAGPSKIISTGLLPGQAFELPQQRDVSRQSKSSSLQRRVSREPDFLEHGGLPHLGRAHCRVWDSRDRSRRTAPAMAQPAPLASSSGTPRCLANVVSSSWSLYVTEDARPRAYPDRAYPDYRG